MVNTQGLITEANDFFQRLSGRTLGKGSPIHVSACFSDDVREAARELGHGSAPHCFSGQIVRNDGRTVPVSVEIFTLDRSGGQMWLILPREASFCHTREVSAPGDGAADTLPAHLFDCLHGGVAQSIAALAMNLHLVSQSDEVPDSPNARELLLGSLKLVEQCSREVRSLSRLLRPTSPVSKANCA